MVNAQWMKVEEITQYHPFLHCLPDDFLSIPKLLQAIGVKSRLELSHIQSILESIFRASEGNSLTVNSENCVKQAIHDLDGLLKAPLNSDSAKELFPLYLPNSRNILKDSKTLLYADNTSYRGIQLDLKNLPYSEFNITPKNYKHSALDICRALPNSVQPIGLSTVCKQVVLDDDPSNKTYSDFALAEQLKKTFTIPEMAEGIVSLFDIIVKKQQNNNDLKEFVKGYLSKIDVVTVKKVKYQIIFKENNICIGINDKKHFCYVAGETKSMLYLSSVLINSPVRNADLYSTIANHLCSMLGQKIEEMGTHQDEIVKGIQFCLGATTSQELQEILNDEFGINLQSERKMETFSKRLGEEVPKCWHHRLDQDLDNVFNPMEYVGYEDREGHIIVAQIVHPVKPKEGEQELEKKFRIYVSEDDEEGKDVSILTLYKFLVGNKKPKVTQVSATETDSQTVATFDADDQIPNLRASLINQSYIEIKKSICDQLRAIWKLSPDSRKTALRRLFLKWHPDKNPDDPERAEQIFKFLMKQIEHLEKGEPLDDPENEETPQGTSHHHYYNRSGNRGHYHYHWHYQSSNFNFGNWNSTANDHYSFSECEETFFSFGGSQRANYHYFPFGRKEKGMKSEGKRWMGQAEVDYKVLCDIHSTADTSNGYSHVCFMAHQVAEKALKGGVYALCGMDGRGIRDHNLTRHAYALQTVKPLKTSGLAQHCVPLEGYYLNTRYPNRWPDSTDIPSDHYKEGDADQAKDHAREVLDVVKSIMPSN